jgi:hypothetical protein
VFPFVSKKRRKSWRTRASRGPCRFGRTAGFGSAHLCNQGLRSRRGSLRCPERRVGGYLGHPGKPCAVEGRRRWEVDGGKQSVSKKTKSNADRNPTTRSVCGGENLVNSKTVVPLRSHSPRPHQQSPRPRRDRHARCAWCPRSARRGVEWWLPIRAF